MKTIKVQNMKTSAGKEAVHQLEITTPNGIYFTSHNRVIAFKPNNNSKIKLDSYYFDYSKTTAKYRNKFLNEGTKQTIKKIENKEYILTNLN